MYGFYYKFELTPVLAAIGLDDEVFKEYERGEVRDVSRELMLLRPSLHPEFGKPSLADVRIEFLLGSDSDWDQVCFLTSQDYLPLFLRKQKIYHLLSMFSTMFTEYKFNFSRHLFQIGKPLSKLDRKRCLTDFIGGFDLIDLESDSHHEAEEASAEASSEQTVSEVAVRGSGTYKCSECEFDSKNYGKKALKSLAFHVKRHHPQEDSEEITDKIKQIYSRDKFVTEKQECDVCGSSIRGSNLNGHQASSACTKLKKKRRL